MRPDVTEQLRGIRQVLADVVGPEVGDAYAADVLNGALAALDVLADGWGDVPSFLRWDCERTTEVLRLVDRAAPAPPGDLFDLDALRAHHRSVRGLLEAAMPQVVDHPGARDAAVRLFRERADRYPLSPRNRGGSAAHPAR
jgi:hypothetical protein